MASKPAVYLDYAAATPVDPSVLKAMTPYFSDNFYNPSATYASAIEAHRVLETARAGVAHWLGARPAEIVFTAGGTEANNLAVDGILRPYIVRHKIVRQSTPNIVISGIEHESVLKPASDYNYREVAVGSDGRLDLDDLRRKIDADTVLVSIMYANNEIGTVQPIRDIATVIAEKRAERTAASEPLPLVFHTDGCQAANYLDLHVARLGVDMMTLNGGKIYGPKQSGALYVKAGTALQPLIRGGGQESGRRSGTENVAAAVGFSKALELAQNMRRDESARLKSLQMRFIERLQKAAPDTIINGSLKYRLPNNVHVTLSGCDNERLLIGLDENGILAAAGSACSASNEEPSHVLKAIGVSEVDAQASLRFTMGRDTTAEAVDRAVRTLSQLLLQQ